MTECDYCCGGGYTDHGDPCYFCLGSGLVPEPEGYPFVVPDEPCGVKTPCGHCEYCSYGQV